MLRNFHEYEALLGTSNVLQWHGTTVGVDWLVQYNVCDVLSPICVSSTQLSVQDTRVGGTYHLVNYTRMLEGFPVLQGRQLRNDLMIISPTH